MPTQKQNIPLVTKGLETGKPGEFVDSRGTPDCLNMGFSRYTIAKRIGESALGDDLGERIMALPELKVGTTTTLARIGLTAFEAYDAINDVWEDAASAPLTGDEANTIDFTFPLLGGVKILVYTNGLDAIRKWTGSGPDDVLGGSPPKARYVIAFGPYLVLANIVDGGNNYYSRVQWCDTGLIETWSGGNAGFQDLIDDEQDITGLALWGDAIAVHKSNCIYLGGLVTTSAVFQFVRKATGAGAVAGATIKNIPGGPQVFLAKDGIRTFGGGNEAPLLPADVQDDIREGLNPAHAYKSCAVVVPEKDEYWVAMPIGSQTEPETVYVYNYKTGQVYKDSRTNLTCFGMYTNTSQQSIDDISTPIDATPGRFDDVTNLSLNPLIVFGHSGGETTRRQGIYTDNEGPISAYWTSKDYTGEDFSEVDDPSVMMRWQGLQVWAKGTGVTVAYSINGGSTWNTIKTLELDSDYPSDDAPDVAYFDVVSSRIRFKFSNAEADGTFALKQFQMEALTRENRR